MAKDTEWQKPLEESLETILHNPDATVKDLEEVRRALSMLCDGESVKSLYDQVDDVFRKRADAFREYSEQVKNGKTLEEVRNAIKNIQALDVYEDKTEILRLGEERTEAFQEQERNEEKAKEIRLKKRKRNIFIAVIACIFAAVLAWNLYSKQRTAKLNEMKEQLQVLVSEGNNSEIVGQLAEMEDYFSTDNDKYSLYETVLEEVAGNHGFATAFELQDMLDSEDESVHLNSHLSFDRWAEGQMNDSSLSPEESWIIAMHSLELERMKSSDYMIVKAFTALLGTIAEDAEQDNSDSHSDIKNRIQEIQPYLATVPVDPDPALQLCYSLESSGMDLKELFPEGILVDIPLGASVSALNENIQSGGENVSGIPDMSKMLPISLVESTSDAAGDEIYNVEVGKQETLVNWIRRTQKEDNHYTIKLLPEYLMRIPEKMRAGSFDECTSVVTMQQLWVMAGWIYTTVSTDFGYAIPHTENKDYRGYFMAMDCVSVHDLSAPDKYELFELEVHDPKFSDVEWYEMNKYKSEIYAPEYMLGEHDLEWLKKKYERTINDLTVYSFLLSHSSLQQKAIEHIQEDDSESLTLDDREEQIGWRRIFIQRKGEGDQQ